MYCDAASSANRGVFPPVTLCLPRARSLEWNAYNFPVSVHTVGLNLLLLFFYLRLTIFYVYKKLLCIPFSSLNSVSFMKNFYSLAFTDQLGRTFFFFLKNIENE